MIRITGLVPYVLSQLLEAVFRDSRVFTRENEWNPCHP